MVALEGEGARRVKVVSERKINSERGKKLLGRRCHQGKVFMGGWRHLWRHFLEGKQDTLQSGEVPLEMEGTFTGKKVTQVYGIPLN